MATNDAETKRVTSQSSTMIELPKSSGKEMVLKKAEVVNTTGSSGAVQIGFGAEGETVEGNVDFLYAVNVPAGAAYDYGEIFVKTTEALFLKAPAAGYTLFAQGFERTP